jgi:hypothetical protein
VANIKLLQGGACECDETIRPFELVSVLKASPFEVAKTTTATHIAEETPLEDSVLRLVSDLDDIRKTLGRSKLQSYGCEFAPEFGESESAAIGTPRTAVECRETQRSGHGSSRRARSLG